MPEESIAPIPKRILEAIAQTDMAQTHYRVLNIVLLATYGNGKPAAKMAGPGISAVTGISNQIVTRALRSLVGRQILKQFDFSAGRRPGIYSVNENVEQWLSKGEEVDHKSDPQGDFPLLQINGDDLADSGEVIKQNDHITLRENWYDMFYVSTGEMYQFRGGKDGKILKDVLQTYGLEKSQKLLLAFHAEWQSGDEWLQNMGLTIGVFRNQIPKMISKAVIQKIQKSDMEERLERFRAQRQRARSGV